MTLGISTGSFAEPSTDISTLYAPRAVHLQTVGELFTGEREAAAAGSGLLVADDLVLTDNHVVPDFGTRYRKTQLDVRVGSRTASVRTGVVIVRDEQRDLALVQITPAVSPRPYCPVAAIGADALVPQGASIYILSYPLDEDASVLPGIIRNKSSGGRWLTNAPLNPNDSGGAVFTATGYLVGLAVGGITEWTDVNGVRSVVTGMNRIIPIGAISAAGFTNKIADHDASGCWQYLTSLSGSTPVALANLGSNPFFNSVVATGAFTAAIAGTPAGNFGGTNYLNRPPLPERLSKSYGLDQMQALHGFTPTQKDYGPFTFAAAQGYKVVGCTFAPVSVNHASNIGCSINADGSSVTFRYTLESGPLYDRWRGWLNGALVLRQEKLPGL